MLQQTQVSTVLAYYDRFLAAYPTVDALAAAPEQDVMQLWAGLGYYSRARNLHACAKQVVARFGGCFPRDVASLETLPGIGTSTAGAIASLAYGVQAPILDGNVKRVFCRYYGVEGYPEQSAVKKQLWLIASANVPATQPGVYNQALMDLGAGCCTPKNPTCGSCPMADSCEALRKGIVGQLPTPKPKKARPRIYYASLLLEDAQGGVLLLPQTEKGIWQDLWVPPFIGCSETPNAAELALCVNQWVGQFDLQAVQADLLSQVPAVLAQPWVIHELTHRQLFFKVFRVSVRGVFPNACRLVDKPVPRIVGKLFDAHRTKGLTQAAVPQQDALDF